LSEGDHAVKETEQGDIEGIDVAYVANLARLALSDEEIRAFQPQLEQIVEYVRKIGTLDLEDVNGTSHAVSIENVFRDDVVKPGLDRETALKNAPADDDGQIIVPRIVE